MAWVTQITWGQTALTSETVSTEYFGFKRGVPYNHMSNYPYFSMKLFLLGSWNRTDEKLGVVWLRFLPFASALPACLHLWLSLALIYPQIIKSSDDASSLFLFSPLPSQLLRLHSDCFLPLVGNSFSVVTLRAGLLQHLAFKRYSLVTNLKWEQGKSVI